MKILIAGTHFTPAQALIEQLKKKPNIDIVYVGRKTTMEGDPSASVESLSLPGMGVKFIPIITGRFQRAFTLYTIPSLLKIPIGLVQAIYIILSEKPDVILSFGGYSSVPLVFAGWLFSIPIVIHEQTLISGLSNRINSLFADKIAISFNSDYKFLGKATEVIGNPIRNDLLQPINNLPSEFSRLFQKAKKENLPILLIMGGNQGSHVINLVIEECLDALTKIACVIHITGENKFRDFERLEKLQNEHYLVKKWIGKEYGTVLSKLDLVISRAGINTLTEVAYLGKPALVVPIPYLYQDEQNRNAKHFEKLGLIKILPQSNLSDKTLLESVKFMLKNLGGFRQKAKNAKKVIIPDAAKRLALKTILLAKKL